MDSYRVEKQAAKIQLPDENAEIDPLPTTGGGRKSERELDRLSNILNTFNDHFGNSPPRAVMRARSRHVLKASTRQ
jgi:type I restriction enzyme R subunit